MRQNTGDADHSCCFDKDCIQRYFGCIFEQYWFCSEVNHKHSCPVLSLTGLSNMYIQCRIMYVNDKVLK